MLSVSGHLNDAGTGTASIAPAAAPATAEGPDTGFTFAWEELDEDIAGCHSHTQNQARLSPNSRTKCIQSHTKYCRKLHDPSPIGLIVIYIRVWLIFEQYLIHIQDLEGSPTA